MLNHQGTMGTKGSRRKRRIVSESVTAKNVAVRRDNKEAGNELVVIAQSEIEAVTLRRIK